jgi:hypothetical protein
MSRAVTKDEEAVARAEGARRVQRGVAAQTAQTALISECMARLVAAGLEAQAHRNGRELAIFERDFDRIAVLVDALVDGNYRDTAARLADIAESGVRGWLQRAEEGDPRYQTIAMVIRAAEAIAESDSVRHVRTAGQDPRFWAAAATWLERKFPDKYGRRSADPDGSKVVIQIGLATSQSPIQVIQVQTPSSLPASSASVLRDPLRDSASE